MKLFEQLFNFQGDSSVQSESHKSGSDEAEEEIDEDIDGVPIQIVEDSEGPTPCKIARKQLLARAHCDGSTTEGLS